ncbi:hypothetical protein EON82_23420, partial [bacterium]
MLRSLFKLGIIVTLAMQLFSCAPAKSFYVLTAEGPAPSGGGMGVGVGPVSLAGYLDRANLVYQEGGNRMA